LEEGIESPLAQARRFGSQEDYLLLERLLRIAKRASVVLVDLTSIGYSHGPERAQAFQELAKSHNVVLLLRAMETILGWLDQSGALTSVPNFVFDHTGKMVQSHAVKSLPKGVAGTLRQTFARESGLDRFRRDWVDSVLYACMKPFVRRPKKGQKFIEMPNSMVVNRYIDTKAMAGRPDIVTFVAYEMARRLTQDFLQLDESAVWPSRLLVANNTALVFASILERLLEADLEIVDHLGPIPNLRWITLRLEQERERLRDAQFVMIQEVSATGKEADMTALYVRMMGGRVTKIMSLYNLEVGRPSLVPRVASLCLPAARMKYVYRSAPHS